MRLFDDIVVPTEQHPIYRKIKAPEYEPERTVLESWAAGFVDRDGKFCREFQTTFEPCLWELYVHAYLKEIGAVVDFNYSSPDFVVASGQAPVIEATIAAPSAGGKPPHGRGAHDIPQDFNEFNRQSTLRVCNSFTAKVQKYRQSYRNKSHVKNRPFVIAIASFDRPFAHFAASRPIISALYGLYYDEEVTISSGADRVISYDVQGVVKSASSDVPLGYFADRTYSEVSAVIYSCLATWGKVRALADNPNAQSFYTTFHPNPSDIKPIVRHTPKVAYREHLLDGLYVFHNPFASIPLNPRTLEHPRIAQFVARDDGRLDCVAPDDFLLCRFLHTFSMRTDEL